MTVSRMVLYTLDCETDPSNSQGCILKDPNHKVQPPQPIHPPVCRITQRENPQLRKYPRLLVGISGYPEHHWIGMCVRLSQVKI